MRAAAEKALSGEPRFKSLDASAEATDCLAVERGPGRRRPGVPLVRRAQGTRGVRPYSKRRKAPVALVWNQRRDSPLNTAYIEMLEALAPDYRNVRESERSSEPKMRAFFAPVLPRTAMFENEQRLDEAGFLGRLTSSSYVPPAGDPRLAPITKRASEIFAEHARDGAVTIAYDTVVWYGPLA